MADHSDRTLTEAERSLIAELALRISPSAKKTFDSCNRQWWYKKVLKIEEADQPHFLLGKAVHALQERYVPTGIYPCDKPEECLRLEEDPWDDYPGGFEQLVVSAVRIAREGIHLVSDAREQAAKVPGSVRVEQQVEGQCGPLPYIGFIDLLKDPWTHPDRGCDLPSIEDYKTSSDPDRYGHQTPAQVAADQQMGFYAWTYWIVGQGHDGDVRLGHHYFPTKGRGAFRTIRGVATKEDLQKNWEGFVATAWDMLDTAKIKDVKQVAPNRSACHMYRGCPFRSICPVDDSYQPTSTPEEPMGMTVAETLAALKAKAEAKKAPEPEPTIPPLTEEQKQALTAALFDLHQNNALSEPALDALLVQHGADPQTAEEVRAAAKELVDSDDGTGRINPPDHRPTPLTDEAKAKAQDEDFEAVVNTMSSLVNAGQTVTVETYTLFTNGKGLDDRRDEVLAAVLERTGKERSELGPLFAEPLANDATPAEKFRDSWERSGGGDVDLSLGQFRDWIKDACGLERYSRKQAVALMDELVEAGLFEEDDDGIYRDKAQALPEGAAGQVTPHPESSIAQAKAQPEESKADEQPLPEEPKPDPEPEPSGTTAAAVHLFLVGCVSPYAMSLDDYLNSIQAEAMFARVALHVKDLNADEPYWMQPFNAGPKALANMLGGLYDDGKLPVPQALWCSGGHPLADALAHELGRRGVYVIRGLR